MQPQRICILGNSGSGKSTLSQALGKRYDLPVFYLDREMLTKNFVSLPHEERVRRHQTIIANDKWVIDGRYSKLMAPRLARSDLVIFLDVPRWRAIPRTLRRNRNPDKRLGAPEGARAAYSWKLLSSQLKFNRRKYLRKLREQLKDYPQVRLVVLGRGSLNDWLKTIDRSN